MSSRTFLFALVLVLFEVITPPAIVRGEQDIAAVPDDALANDFKGKIVLLEVNRSSAVESDSDTVLLQNVRVTKLGDRQFLVGIGYTPNDDKEYWYKDMLVGVPCDSILRFSAMTPAQCEAFMKRWREQLQE